MLKEEEEKKRRLGGRTKTVRQSHEMNNQADNDDAHRSKKKDGLGSIIESWSNVEVSPKSPGYLHVRRQAVGGAGGCAEALEAFACSVLWRPVYLSIRGNRALRLRSILFLGSCAAASPAVLCPLPKGLLSPSVRRPVAITGLNGLLALCIVFGVTLETSRKSSSSFPFSSLFEAGAIFSTLCFTSPLFFSTWLFPGHCTRTKSSVPTLITDRKTAGCHFGGRYECVCVRGRISV